MNESFETYKDMYFDNGISSVYLWDLDGGFAGVHLIKKVIDNGSWDSIHVFEVNEHGRESNYKLTSTVLLSLVDDLSVNLAGSITRQVEFILLIFIKYIY